MKNIFFILCGLWLLSGCASVPEVHEPVLYQKYQIRSAELRDMVQQGYLGVAEAEELRREAFNDYLEELRQYRLEREKRNY